MCFSSLFSYNYFSRLTGKISLKPLDTYETWKRKERKVIIVHQINVCSQRDSRWPPQPSDFYKPQNYFNSVSFTDLPFIFHVVVDESDAQHIF